MSLRCWLFGHEWMHLDTSFMSGESRKLRSSHICDRCDDKRTIVMSVSYEDDGPLGLGEREPAESDADSVSEILDDK